MGSISDLAQELMKDETFIQDLARYSENLLTEKFIRKKYGNLDEATWTRLGENDSLIEKIEDLKLRRCRDGSSKREKAQQLVVKTVDVLGDIALNAGNSPKHRIDASKTLDAFATNKATLFEMSDQLPGSRILPGRWGLEHFAIGLPKGREAAMPLVSGFANDVKADGRVARAVEHAGLRGVVLPD